MHRAIYKDTDVYLLDDPLSAVDPHVGRHLFEDCIAGFLKGKTVILATHQLHHLKQADLILVLDNVRHLLSQSIAAQDWNLYTMSSYSCNRL